MSELENRLAEARVSKLEWDDPEEQWHREWWWLGFDAAAAIARNVAAEKDDEIAKASAENREIVGLLAEKDAKIGALKEAVRLAAESNRAEAEISDAKDAEIARLEATLGATSLSAAGWQERATLAETRKVSDAQSETLLSNALAEALRQRGYEHVWDANTQRLTVTPIAGCSECGEPPSAPVHSASLGHQYFGPRVALAEPRKVSDAQRERFYERLERDVHRSLATIIGNDLLAIIESPADAEATT